MNGAGYRYELICEVDPEHSRQYREIMTDAVIQWLGMEGLSGFRSMSAVDGMRVRLEFKFADRQALDRFTTDEDHRETLDALRSVCLRVECDRWQPRAVSLVEGDSATAVPDGGTNVAERISD